MTATIEFIVCIHDVCPQTSSAVLSITDRLHGLIGSSLSVAVIPLPNQCPWTAEYKHFADELTCRTGEILLHGLTHRRARNLNPFSYLIENADELAGLSAGEMDALLEQGQSHFRTLFGKSARGFVPPGWHAGPIHGDLLNRHHLEFITTLFHIIDTKENKIPLACWSWDCGRIPILGFLGEALGSLRYTHSADMFPCIVLHPKDAERGFLSRSLRIISGLLEKGCQPITFSQLYDRKRKHVY